MTTGNRSPRNPGQVQRFDAAAQIADTPDYVVPSGQAAAAIAALGGSVAGRLKQMAAKATAKQRDLQGMAYGQQQGNATLDRLTAMAAGQAESSGSRLNADVDGHVAAAASRYGVSADTLRMIAGLESSGNPAAQNPSSSAGGLFQFTDGTAADYQLADRFDPAQASDAAARLLRDNTSYLAKQLGRAPTPAELYLAHQQGAGGATKLLTNPGASAASIVGADAVTLNGGTADMTAGEFAQLWLTKAGQTPTSLPAIAQPNLPPLQLRDDNSIGGGAFDAAAIRTYGDRLMTAVSSELSTAYAEHKDSPQGWQQAVNEIKTRYSGDENLGDPRVRDYFDKVFYENTLAYSASITAGQQRRVLAEETAALTETLQAQKTALSKQAMLLGGNPAAEGLLAGQTQRLLNRIDAAVEDGHLTPDQAVTERASIATELAYGRAEGTFNSLSSPSAKQHFANGLMQSWDEGEPLLDGLTRTQVQALAERLGSQADAEQSELMKQSVGERARVQGILESDVASVRNSGREVDLRTQGINLDQLAVLGLDVNDYAARKRAAREEWTVTQGMAALPAGDLEARVATLMPQPGAPDYRRRLELYSLAEEEKEAILKERLEDPLGQAARAGLVELQPVDPGSPDSLALRKQQAEAVSVAYGTPVSYFRTEERTAMTAALYQQPELMPGFALGVVEAFGDKAPAALAEVSDAAPELAYAAGITAALGDNGIISEVSRVIAARRDKTINVKLPSDAVMTKAAGEVIGSALAANPATRSAALNVAQILFEGQAAAIGFDPAEVKEPGSAAFTAWQRSVNRALGARTINGVQYGGLATINGAQTVAPSSMPADRLQQLVSSISAEDLQALPPIGSGNGVPVAAWQLQGAKLVAVGDGQYRVALGDPNGFEPQFLTQPGGGYWVLDAAELERLKANRASPSITGPQYTFPAPVRPGGGL